MRMIDFAPVLLSGSNSNPRSRSICRHSSFRISRSRAPVRINSRMAAAAKGSTTVRRFASFATMAAVPDKPDSPLPLPLRSFRGPCCHRFVLSWTGFDIGKLTGPMASRRRAAGPSTRASTWRIDPGQRHDAAVERHRLRHGGSNPERQDGRRRAGPISPPVPRDYPRAVVPASRTSRLIAPPASVPARRHGTSRGGAKHAGSP